jgi:hypothetical protein
MINSIWEKKYGKNANHKKQEQGAEQLGKRRARQDVPRADRHRQNTSSAPDTGFRGRSEATSPSFGWAKRNKLSTERVPRGETPPKTTSTLERRPLHPSWEAKKKLKEKQSVEIVSAQGKKIRFA